MKMKGAIVLVYGILLLIGGMMGYAKAHSLPSLIMGTASGVLVLISGIALLSGKVWAKWLAFVLSTVLFGFFAYRFALSGAFFPAGMMSLVSFLVGSILFFGKQECCACPCPKA